MISCRNRHVLSRLLALGTKEFQVEGRDDPMKAVEAGMTLIPDISNAIRARII